MQPLEGLDGGQSAPVDSVDVPHSDWAHDTTNAVAKETNRDGAQDDGGGAQGQVVEEVLSRKHHDTGGCIRGRRCRDGAHSVLLQGPGAGIDEMDEGDPFWAVALATLGPPPSLKLVPARQEGGPCLAEEVGYEHDESARDGNCGRFELGVLMSAPGSCKPHANT